MRNQVKRWLAPLEDMQILETTWLLLKYSRARKSNKELPTLKYIFIKTIELFTNRLKIVRKDNSFAGEHQILVETMKSQNINNGYLVDIGAADGIRQSSTVGFLTDPAWEGTLFEYHSEAFSRLAFLYNDSHRVNLAKTKVTPLNVGALFEGFNIPKEFDYLNIDIDSYDLSILRVLIDTGFRPKIISMEVNEKFPPNIYFEVLYSSEHTWSGDHFFGCSLTAAYESLANRGYKIHSLGYNNAIFVDNFSIPLKEEDLEIIYKRGYLQKKDRKKLFPWNDNIEILQHLTSGESENYLNKLFEAYRGKYRLERRPLNG